MPEKMALLTALLLDRPLCRDCVIGRAHVTEFDMRETLERIARVLVLREYESDRCRSCGDVGRVFVLEAPPMTSRQTYKEWIVFVTPRRVGLGYRGDVDARTERHDDDAEPVRITSTMVVGTEEAAVDEGFRLGREWVDRRA